MSLFDIAGWSVPGAPVASHSKKRKRPTNDTDKLHTTEVNIEKLISKLGASQGAAAEDQQQKKKNKKPQGKHRGFSLGNSVESITTRDVGEPSEEKRAKRTKRGELASSSETLNGRTGSEKSGKRNKKRTSERPANAVPSAVLPSPSAPTGSGLTDFQAKLQSSLHGAKFRWINETLYKSDSEHAHRMLRDTPSMFSEYHTGFRRQVQSWPSNPVSYYVSTLSQKPPKSVIADLGCGDASLARALQPKGFTVLSYDLVSDNEYVTEADVCAHIPLPGTEEGEEGIGSAQVVDVVVCALSLMGTNWPKCIREAWRILRPDGELRVAEVASRFSDVEAFTSLIGSIGFKLRSTDDSNTHFTLFEFTKAARKSRSDKEWDDIMAGGHVLKPCEYKRR